MDFHFIVMLIYELPIILISDQIMIFLMQFGTKKPFYLFQGLQIALHIFGLLFFFLVFICSKLHSKSCAGQWK